MFTTIVVINMPLIDYDILGSFLEKISFLNIHIRNLLLFGKKQYNCKNIDLIGYQTVYLTKYLPSDLLIALNGGGICIPKKLYSNTMLKYCKDNHLKLAIFSVNSIIEYKKYYNADIIFVDNLDIIRCKYLNME